MGIKQKLIDELKAIGLAMLYFGCWLAALIVLKKLMLDEYQIQFNGFSKALIGALILSKVVLVLEHVPLGAWIQARPAWVDILLRTILYSLGVLLVLILEKAFEGRHEYGGFGSAFSAMFQHPDMPHILVNALVLSGALLGYNVLSVLRANFSEGGLLRVFLTPVPEEMPENQSESHVKRI